MLGEAYFCQLMFSSAFQAVQCDSARALLQSNTTDFEIRLISFWFFDFVAKFLTLHLQVKSVESPRLK